MGKLTVQLKPGREFQLRRGHPWLFSGAIQQVVGTVTAGEIVDVVDSEGLFIARGYYNPKTDIAVRVLTQDATEDIDTVFFGRRIQRAWASRQQAIDLQHTNVFRLVYAEGDFLPGLVIDWYAGVAVIQSHTAGIDQLLPMVTDALIEVMRPQGILLRSDVVVRSREGVARQEARVLYGEVPAVLTVEENGLHFVVDPWQGQKTGFFADQRDKRKALQRYSQALYPGAKLLNCFCYSAGFSVAAAKVNPGLITVNLDQSEPALALAQQNFQANQLDLAQHQFIETDAFTWLEAKQKTADQYDLVILDPPAFAKSQREKSKALQGYYRVNTLGLELVRDGGILVTCSCSGTITLKEFEESLREASIEAGRTLQVLETFGHGPDHPINLLVPEGEYLKVLFCRVG